MFSCRRISGLLAVALALITLGTDQLFSQGQQPARRRTVMLDGREVVQGEVIVRYRSQSGRIERERAEFQAEADTSESIGRRGARRVHSRRLTTRQLLTALRANPDVELAEPNYIIRANAIPNDSSMGSLWGLLNTGQEVAGQPGTPGADVGAAAAWDRTTGSRANIVAIIDTGIDFTHPDLAANVFTAPRQFSVTIGDFTVTCQPGSHGFNALNNSCAPFDDNGHGSHVAGIIGAVGNNNLGVTGVNWTTTLMPLKVLDGNGNGTTSDAIKAIDFAIKAKAALGADANVRVLNASWGGSQFSQALDDEIEAANAADMLFVAAAGSDGTDNDALPHYPASSTHANVISVTAIDNTGALAWFSNYGANSVDLAAPGYGILSTFSNGGYESLSGTSMAAPFVSGAAALILSACESDTATLKSALLSGVDPDSGLVGKTLSGGRLNVNNAIHEACPNLPNPAPTVTLGASPQTIGSGQTSTLAWSTTNATTVTIDQGIGAVATSGNRVVTPSSTTTYTITATGAGGTTTATATVTITAGPTINFTASPLSIRVGESTTLTWTVSNATSVTIDQQIGAVASSASLAVSPNATTTYHLAATGPGGSANANVTVEVLPAQAQILWRHSSGMNYLWLVNGTERIGEGGLPDVSPDWQLAGIGDYNGDGHADILWRHISSGMNYLWLMNGITRIDEGPLATVDPAWQLAGSGDYNGDGRSDILWRHSSGTNYMWLMDGFARIGEGHLAAVDPAWQLAGTGDYNGDGRDDILWRQNGSGMNYLWFMNGTTRVGEGFLPTVDPAWQLAGSADYNGDGRADILWRQDGSGMNYMWLLNGTTTISEGYLATVDPSWQLAGTADYNSDGHADLLWRHTSSGMNYLWLMNGIARIGEGPLATVDPAWQMVYAR